MTDPRTHRRLAAILAADVVGYSRLMGVDEAGTLAALRSRGHRAEMGSDWSEGRLTGARRENDGQIFAGANPRGMQGYAVGR